jgi:two-component system, OmpR family, sensor histidine kinase AdeS
MTEKTPQSLWRWICLRVLSLAAGSVMLIALFMWLRFALTNLSVQQRMPAPVREEFARLRADPDLDLTRYHEIIDHWYGLSFSDPSIASSDWLTLGILVLIVSPLIVILGLYAARPLSRQFSHLTGAAAAIASGVFSTRAQRDKAAPAELMLFTDHFNAMALRLERYDKELRTSHVATAHELRSPLTAAMGRLQGIMDDVFPADKEQLGMVIKQLRNLSQLIDDLHLLSLAEAGQLSLHTESISLLDLVQEKISWLKPQATAAGFMFQVALPQGEYLADPLRLGQVFSILMDNALRYATEGHTLLIQGENDGGRWTIHFRDNGPGVDPAFLPVIFDRFTRAEASRSRHSGGGGLGLSIAKAICEAHGGLLTATPAQQGQGLCFTVTLPANAEN